jgi:hypothetical protein
VRFDPFGHLNVASGGAVELGAAPNDAAPLRRTEAQALLRRLVAGERQVRQLNSWENRVMSKAPWYAAQVIFLHSETVHGPKQTYEERITLLRAVSFDDAIVRAEKEAEEYCRDLDRCKYVGYVNVFQMYDGKLVDGTEIFSNMRKSDLKPKEYLDLHYPHEPDDCEVIGEGHRWHNLDGNRSACYHCKSNSRWPAVDSKKSRAR